MDFYKHIGLTTNTLTKCLFCNNQIVKNKQILKLASSCFGNNITKRGVCEKCLKLLIYNIDKSILRPKIVRSIENEINYMKL